MNVKNESEKFPTPIVVNPGYFLLTSVNPIKYFYQCINCEKCTLPNLKFYN